MTDTEVATMARKLAMHWIQGDVDRGITEDYIRSCQGGSGRGHKHWANDPDGFGGYRIAMGGYYDRDPATGLMRKRTRPDQILVTVVYGIEGVWIFNLHEIYEECKKGQLSLL